MSTTEEYPSEMDYKAIDKKKIVDAVSKILSAIGEDPQREGLSAHTTSGCKCLTKKSWAGIRWTQ